MDLEVVYNHDTLCVLVVGAGDGPKSFLASGVPDLHLHCCVVEFEGSKDRGEGYLNLKSTPMVARYDYSNESSANLRSRDDLPTELSPISTILYW